MHHYRLHTFLISLIFLALSTTNTMASGRYSSGSGNTSKSNTSSNNYNIYKSVFYKRTICDACPFPGRGKNAQDASALIQEIKANSGSGLLSSRDQQFAIRYLQRRYSIAP